MSHAIELSDEQYETLQQVAAERGETPETLILAVIQELRDLYASAHAFDTDDWFRHLGASEDQIAEAKRIARERSDANSR